MKACECPSQQSKRPAARSKKTHHLLDQFARRSGAWHFLNKRWERREHEVWEGHASAD